MKTIPVSLLVAGMLLPAVCLAQPPRDLPGKEKSGKPGGDRPFHEAWRLADADRSGSISQQEFGMMPRLQKLPQEKREMLFDRMDENGDGEISRDELAHLGKPHEGQPDPPAKRLWELDADRSGGISFEEFKLGPIFKKLPPEKQQKVFGHLDTDGNGVVTPQDKPEPPFKHPGGRPRPESPEGNRPENNEKPEQLLRRLDINGDGALSFEEFRAGPSVKKLTEDEQEDRFESLDRNGDQKISQEDFTPPPPPSE